MIRHRLAGRVRVVGADEATDAEPAWLADAAGVTPAAHIRDAAKAALDRGETHYTARQGIPQLQAAIARSSSADGYIATADTTIVTNGGAEARYIALQSTLKPGDILLAGTPLPAAVVELVEFIGARVVALPDFGANVGDALDAVRSVEGAVLLLATPCPQTGRAIPPDTLEQLVAAAIERGLVVVIDRTLAWCCYEPEMATFPNRRLAENVFTLGSFSTAYAMAGWRVGYLTAPVAGVNAPEGLKQAMSICTSPITQFAALAALEDSTGWLAERSAEMRRRRDALVTACAEAGYPVASAPDAWPPMFLDRRLLDALPHRTVSAAVGGYPGFERIELDMPQQAFERLLVEISALPPGSETGGRGWR